MSVLHSIAVLQNGCCGSQRDSDNRVQIHPSISPPIHITRKGIFTWQWPVNHIYGQERANLYLLWEPKKGILPTQGLFSLISLFILRQLRRLTGVIHWGWSSFIKTTSAHSWKLQMETPLITGGRGTFPTHRLMGVPKSSFELCSSIPLFFQRRTFALTVACWLISYLCTRSLEITPINNE